MRKAVANRYGFYIGRQLMCHVDITLFFCFAFDKYNNKSEKKKSLNLSDLIHANTKLSTSGNPPPTVSQAHTPYAANCGFSL